MHRKQQSELAAVGQPPRAVDTFGRASSLIVLALIALALFFRVWRLTTIPGLNGDEAEYGANCLDLLHHHSVGWHTNNGNLRNPFYYLPLLLLHTIFAPSIALLRITAVVYGIAALALNWMMCRRVFDARTALATTFLLAVVPEDIIQSRLGWDPSQSLLIDVAVYYFALLVVARPEQSRAMLARAVIALVAAVMIHPTNIFMAVPLGICCALRWRSEIRSLPAPATSQQFVGWASLALVFAVGVGYGATRTDLTVPLVARYAPLMPIAYLQLFSGITAFYYIAGSCGPTTSSDLSRTLANVAALAVLFPAAIYAGTHIRRRSAHLIPVDLCVFLSWLVTVPIFWFLGILSAVRPGNERYALVLIVPTVVAVTRSYARLSDGRSALRLGLAAGALAIGTALLVAFYVNVFQYTLRTGGTGEDALRAGPVDPKLQAWRLIQAQCAAMRVENGGSGSCMAVTSTWWIEQPVKYFAAGGSSVLVPESTDSLTDPTTAALIDDHLVHGRLWILAFSNSPAETRLQQRLIDMNKPFTDNTVTDYAGRPVIDVLHVLPPEGSLK